MHVLVIDIGGSSVKVFATWQKQFFTIRSGRSLTPNRLIPQIQQRAANWKYDRVSIGYPGRVEQNRPAENAPNLGRGWVNYDYKQAFKKPIKFLNDAAMQALGSYRGGRMLFLGLGTGFGSCLILESVVHPTEVGDLNYRDNKTYADYLGKAEIKHMGATAWVQHVKTAVRQLKAALQVDYVVLGGGQAKLVPKLPSGVLRGDNSKAFVGGVRAWEKSLRRQGSKLAFV
jgi:predicted NBD/HSP70 family sugar kinase